MTGRYRPWDQEEKLGEPPWSKDDPKLQAWEAAHGHDVRLKCYPEFGCQALEAEHNRLREFAEWVVATGAGGTAQILDRAKAALGEEAH
jgi:hypothetical protein